MQNKLYALKKTRFSKVKYKIILINKLKANKILKNFFIYLFFY